MARPKKNQLEKRIERFNLRFTSAEIEHIRLQAEAAGLYVAEYLRRRCLGKKVIVPAISQLDPALVSAINNLGREVSGLGNVTNQVALYLHTERSIPDEWGSLPQEIKRTQRQISEVLEQVVLSLD